MQNTVVQTTECVKTDLQVGANMPALGIQEAAPPYTCNQSDATAYLHAQ